MFRRKLTIPVQKSVSEKERSFPQFNKFVIAIKQTKEIIGNYVNKETDRTGTTQIFTGRRLEFSLRLTKVTICYALSSLWKFNPMSR